MQERNSVASTAKERFNSSVFATAAGNMKTGEIMFEMLERLVKRLSLLAVILVILTLPPGADAKELASRLGVGYSNSYSINLPSVAAIYYPSSNWGLTGALGIDTQSQNSSFAISAGLRKILFTEDNMNFFAGGVLNLLSQSIAGVNNSGFEIGALVGGEFFFAGLENLGFSFATGIAVTDVTNVRFRTLGQDFLNAGIIFYF